MGNLVRILSIDGGGLRGIIPATVLSVLESKLQHRTGDQNARAVDYFDLIAGTSTGALLGCTLLLPEPGTGRPRYSARDGIQLYQDHGSDIFHIPLRHKLMTAGGLRDEKYPAANLERVMSRLFGDAWLSELLKPCLVTAYDIQRRRAVFFTQHDAVERPNKDFLLRDVIRAATAAPTYFEVANVSSRTGVCYPLVDGAVFANNPTLCAFAEARTHFGATADSVVILSLGTGRVRQPYEYADAKDWGSVGWLRPLINIMMTSSSETVDYECGLTFNGGRDPNRYLRVDVDMSVAPAGVSPNIDDATPANLRGLCELGAEAAEQSNPELDQLAELLVRSGPAAGRESQEVGLQRGIDS